MARQQLQAQVRTVLGKQVKQMRRAGRLPGVVYGPLMETTVQVSVDSREFQKFYQRFGQAALIDLTWDGGGSPVFIRDVQQDPVKRTAVHVDFFAPNMSQKVRTAVPVVLQNENPNHTGVLTEQISEVEVEGSPDAIPSQIAADISGLVSAGDALRVGDLVMPAGIVVITAAETVIALLDDTSNDRAAQGAGAGTGEEPEDVPAIDEPEADAEAGAPDEA